MRDLSKPLSADEERQIFREKRYMIGVDRDGMVNIALRGGYAMAATRTVRERSPGRALDKLAGR